jgi:hypothetical protein
MVLSTRHSLGWLCLSSRELSLCLLDYTQSRCVRCCVDARYELHFGVADTAHGDKVADVSLVDRVVSDVIHSVHDALRLELASLYDTLERRVASFLAHLRRAGRLVVVVHKRCVTALWEEGDVNTKVHGSGVVGLWKSKR